MTVRVWIQAGQALRQGTWITAVLWVASLGVHLGYDYLVDGKGPQSGLGSASLTLYFAVTYTIQRFILQAKAQRLAAGPGRTSAIAAPTSDSGNHRGRWSRGDRRRLTPGPRPEIASQRDIRPCCP